MRDAPDRDPVVGGPTEPAPTGTSWVPVETDAGCGRSGLAWVLVDEVCGDGDGRDPRALETPMFRDGALVGGHLLAVDATHLWSLNLAGTQQIERSALLSGIGQPLAVAANQNRLYVAAGLEGLVVVDAASPSAPSRAASLPLPAPAFDVALDGTTGYVATGHAGVAAVDIGGPTPTLKTTIALPGHYAAGVATDAANVYVAACTAFAVVDRASGALKGTVPFPKVQDRLPFPAKDVAIVGDVAFVASGAQGVVAIDVSTPTAPTVLGRCNVDEPSFYASGVRAEGSTVFVAGGEWGVLRVDATNPKTACTKTLAQPPKPAGPAVGCTEKPPWEVVAWESVWAPPPPGKDPIQVLPSGDKVFAFGDARRIGVRAVDVRASTDLSLLRRYDEPRTLLGIAARGQRLVATGPRGGVFRTDPVTLVERVPSAAAPTLEEASAVTLLPDGRWVALKEGDVFVEGRATPITSSASAIAVRGEDVVAGTPTTVEVFSGADFESVSSSSHPVAHLPISLAAGEDRVIYAAPEWLSAARQPVTGGVLGALVGSPPHEIFDQEDIMDASLWRMRVPRRHLAVSASGVVELAVLGPRAGLVVHGANIERTALPALTYAGLAADAGHAYAIGLDRGLYKSYLVTVALAPKPRVTSIEAFTGAASGVAASGDRVYVSDADGAIRVYETMGDSVAPLGVVRLQEQP